MAQRLGQHFLVSQSALRRIAEAACPDSQVQVIEIGPGKGALTAWLLDRAEHVIAVELDSRLAVHLRERFGSHPRLLVVEADVLETDLSQWGRAPVVGNLPYYITSPILEKVLRLGPDLVPHAVFLIQREVAERLVARPGTRDYGFLTVQTQFFARPELLFTVPPGAFQPPPKVDSAVVRLTLRPEAERVVTEDTDGFLRFLGRSFAQKRKTLRNNLAGFYGKNALDGLPEASLRAEQLPLEQFAALYRRLAS